MKKLVAVLVVLGLAGVANAAFIEDFESLTPGNINGQNGWTDTGMGAWYRANYPASVGTDGIGANPQAGIATGDPRWMGYAGHDVSGIATAGGFTLTALTGTIVAGGGNTGIIVGDYRLIGTGNGDGVPNLADHIYLQSNHAGYTYVAAYNDWVGDSTEIGPDDGGDMRVYGWYLEKLELDFGAGTFTASVADADDTTGAQIGPWVDLVTKALPDGLDSPAEVVSAGFYVHKDVWVDEFTATPEPVTLSILVLGAGLALLRRRR